MENSPMKIKTSNARASMLLCILAERSFQAEKKNAGGVAGP